MHVTAGPFQWPPLDEEVQAAMQAAYQDGSWGRYDGPHGAGLREDLCSNFACEHALLCSSGTIGVELALRGCGVEAGDQVVLAAYDFAGNFRAIEAIGARPVLVDVGLDTWTLDIEALADVENERVKAVVVSHLHGGLADMPKLMRLARERGWFVVEDACQQPGATVEAQPVGSFGEASVLSFGGSKLLTAGRGGAVLTKDAQINQRMKVFAERGNWAFPLSELQAAVLRPQLAKLQSRNLLRAESIQTLIESTFELGDWLRPIKRTEKAAAAYYKFAWSHVAAEQQPELRDRLIAGLQSAGVPIDVGFRGFTRRSERRCDRVGSLENSKRLSQSTILLHHPMLLAHKEAVLQVAEVLRHIVLRHVARDTAN